MLTRAGTGRGSGAGWAFTLVELLLSITLLLLLISALVFNFAGMRHGADLREGETQVEALLRFARGYAASSGRLVQIQLTNEVAEGTNLVFSMVSEVDSVHNPGYFEPVFEAKPYLDQIGSLVSVTDVRLLDAGIPLAANLTSTNSMVETNAPAGVFPSITFYPDGSSDSAEIRIISRDEEDSRKIAISLKGEIGGVTHRYVSDALSSDELENLASEEMP